MKSPVPSRRSFLRAAAPAPIAALPDAKAVAASSPIAHPDAGILALFDRWRAAEDAFVALIAAVDENAQKQRGRKVTPKNIAAHEAASKTPATRGRSCSAAARRQRRASAPFSKCCALISTWTRRTSPPCARPCREMLNCPALAIEEAAHG